MCITNVLSELHMAVTMNTSSRVSAPDDTFVTNFTLRTKIATSKGDRAIVELKGYLIITCVNGLKPLAWIGKSLISAPELAKDNALHPILIWPCAFGDNLPDCDMVVSRRHEVLMTSPSVELLC
jgi:hypothetical protein